MHGHQVAQTLRDQAPEWERMSGLGITFYEETVGAESEIPPHIVVETSRSVNGEWLRLMHFVLNPTSFTRHPEFKWYQDVEYTPESVAQTMKTMNNEDFWKRIIEAHDKQEAAERDRHLHELINRIKECTIDGAIPEECVMLMLPVHITVPRSLYDLFREVSSEVWAAAASVHFRDILYHKGDVLRLITTAMVPSENLGVYVSTTTVGDQIGKAASNAAAFAKDEMRGIRR